MGDWNVNWKLTAATTEYSGFDVGKFTLKRVSGQTGKFKVETSPGESVAQWQDVEFQRVPGMAVPDLPWSLPKSPTLADLAGAGAHVKELVKKRWGDAGQIYEFLMGDVPKDDALHTIVLFKVDEGLAGGKDFLVGYLKIDLEGGGNSGGSVSGVRR